MIGRFRRHVASLPPLVGMRGGIVVTAELVGGPHCGRIVAGIVPADSERPYTLTAWQEREDGGIELCEYTQRFREPARFDLSLVYVAWHLPRFTIIEEIWPNPAPVSGRIEPPHQMPAAIAQIGRAGQ